jgi:excisionase family DNA binding protein
MGRIPKAMTLNAGALGSSTPEPGASLLLTVEELADFLRVGRRAAYEAVARGDIPGTVRIGRSIRISRPAIEAWLGANTGQRVEEERREGET